MNTLMDDQHLFNFIIAVAGFLGMFVFKSITSKQARFEEKLELFGREYVHKDDYRRDIAELKQLLHSIYDKLDAKVDKNHHHQSRD